jgi:isoleucyl-tRNA synthetase
MFVNSLVKLSCRIKKYNFHIFSEELAKEVSTTSTSTTSTEIKKNNKDRKKKEGASEESGKYSATVILPQTTFDQRANSLKREPELQKFWLNEKIYENTIKNNKGVDFILHDGPPYANGNLHIGMFLILTICFLSVSFYDYLMSLTTYFTGVGHSLNKILKDIINKYQILKGNKVKYVPGWDCHGLPIELKVLQTLKTKEREQLTPLLLRKKAAEFAKETMNAQKIAFQRYGIWGDFENPYLTLQPQYEAAQIRVFGDMMIKGK